MQCPESMQGKQANSTHKGLQEAFSLYLEIFYCEDDVVMNNEAHDQQLV